VPILNFWSIQSARYAVDTRDASGIGVSIYYDPHHPYNVARLQRAAHAALDYYRANFGPYQFRYARIVEFPGYASFAQAFAGTMPFSESIGFLGNFSDPDKIDYATYVAAHELSHQYWGHQEVSADMQGGTMMVETLAQYSALMVMKHLYGPDKIRRFLRYELDQYLASRGREAIEELPLARVENQPYIHYRKGAVALYLLQDRLGEDRVNAMLRGILDHYRFKGAPFSTSMDLVRGFHGLARNAQEHELVADLLETITLWDFKADGATTRKRPDGQWETTLTITAAKERDNGKGCRDAGGPGPERGHRPVHRTAGRGHVRQGRCDRDAAPDHPQRQGNDHPAQCAQARLCRHRSLQHVHRPQERRQRDCRDRFLTPSPTIILSDKLRLISKFIKPSRYLPRSVTIGA
jgi:hypothetical protein